MHPSFIEGEGITDTLPAPDIFAGRRHLEYLPVTLTDPQKWEPEKFSAFLFIGEGRPKTF